MNRFKVMEMVKVLLLVVVMLVGGILFLIAGNFESNLWLEILIWLFAILGIYMIVHYFVNMKELKKNNALIFGIVLSFACLNALIMGAYELMFYAYPLFLVVAGALALSETIQAKKDNCKTWWQPLVMTIVQFMFAILYILLWVFSGGEMFMYIIGVELLLDAMYIGITYLVFNIVQKAE